MNSESLSESNQVEQSNGSRIFSMLNFTGLQNFSAITNQFAKKREESHTTPPENISEIQLNDVSSIQLDQTDRALTTRHQGAVTERAEDTSMIDTKSDRPDLEQLKLQIYSEIKKNVLDSAHRTSETEVTNRIRFKGMSLQPNLVKTKEKKELKDSLYALKDTPSTPFIDFKKFMAKFWTLLLFFLKFLGVSILIVIIAEFSTYHYSFPGFQKSFCLLMDGLGTSIALVILVHNLLTKHNEAETEILVKYRGVWKVHLAVVFFTTGGTNLLGFIFFDLAYHHPIWILIIKAILIFVDMIIYALYLSYQRQRYKQHQEFSLEHKQVRTFFNVNVYKNFSKEMQNMQEEITKKTEERANKLKTVNADILGKKREQKEEPTPQKNLSIHRNQLLKGRHHLTNMLTFRKGFLFSLLITLPFFQLLISIELLIAVKNLVNDWKPGVFLVSIAYPIIMFLIKLILLYIQRSSNDIMSRENVEYICLTFAALPFRFFYVALNEVYDGFILIVIKLAYKTCVYLIYALILPRLYKKLVSRNYLGKVRQAAQEKPPAIIADLIKANTNTLPTAPDKGRDKSPKEERQTVTLGDERRVRKSRFRGTKKNIFDMIEEQERKQEESQKHNYEAIIVKFNILQFVDICYLIAVLIGLLALRIFQITHPLRRLTYDGMWQIGVWNSVEFICELAFMGIVRFFWRRNQEFKRILTSTDTWHFLKSNFATGVAFHLMCYFTIYYFVSNFWDSDIETF